MIGPVADHVYSDCEKRAAGRPRRLLTDRHRLGLLCAALCTLALLAGCTRIDPSMAVGEVPAASGGDLAQDPASEGSEQVSEVDRSAPAARVASLGLHEAPPPVRPVMPVAVEEEAALLDELLSLVLPEPPKALTHEEWLRNTRSELPLMLNSHVERLLTYFTKTTRGKATLRISLGRGSAYREMIERILEEEEVPKELFFLAMAESGFRPKARSHASATGMWQFISWRGSQYGLRQDRYVDLRYDPETATRAAAKHLKDLHIEFNDWYLAMAAYNSGPGRVKRAVERARSRDFWELSRRRLLPRETRNYVPIILAMSLAGLNLDLFDVGEVDHAPELRYDTVRTEHQTSFALIADATGTSVETIKDLNPGLLRSATPPYSYDLRLPFGSGEGFATEVALVPPEQRLHWRRYEVRDGETLAAIANRYRVSEEKLLALNSLEPETGLKGGQRLTVPTKTRLAIYRYYGGGPAGGLLEPGTGRYRIASGDTLGAIARRFGTTVASLQQWNGLQSTRIRAGRYLIVDPDPKGVSSSAGAKQAQSGSSPAPPRGSGSYRIRSGDNLATIARRFGVTVRDLQRWNGLSGTRIRAGDNLIVGPGAPSSTTAGVSGGRSTTYRIRSGDNLATIARRFGVTVRDLQRWNGLSGTRIRAGDNLIVGPGAPSSTTAGVSGGSFTTYRIRSGDTLGAIARRFGVSVRDLQRWNGLSGTRIRAGKSLRIASPPA